MPDQSHFWSQAAARYEQEFVDPYREPAGNPLLAALAAIPDAAAKTVADLGCGIGPLLPILSPRFRQVIAVDFAPGMLDRARERCADPGQHRIPPVHPDRLAPLAGQRGCGSLRQLAHPARGWHD